MEDQFQRYLYRIGDQVFIQFDGQTGTVQELQRGNVYRVDVPGVRGPLFYSEVQLSRIGDGRRAAELPVLG
jgi:hypothetical protein